MNKYKQKHFHIISYLTIFIGLILIAYVAYFSFYNFDPIQLYNQQGQELKYDESKQSFYGIEIENKQKFLKKDQVYYYILNYCRTTNVKADVEKHLVDGIFIEINDIDYLDGREPIGSGGSFQKGCENNIRFPFYISDKVIDGEYKLRIRVDYNYSPIRKVTRFFFTEPFNVTN